MDQNAIRLTKLLYRKRSLSDVLSNEGEDITQCLKNINLKDAMWFLHQAWEEVHPSLLQKCWNKLTVRQEWEDEDLLPLAEISNRISTEKRHLQEIERMVQQIVPDDQVNENEIDTWLHQDDDLLLMAEDDANEDELEEEEAAANV